NAAHKRIDLATAHRQRLLIGVAVDHEWRRARGIDDVDAHLRKLGDLGLTGRDRRLEFVERAAPHVEAERDQARGGGQHALEVLKACGALRRPHDADGAEPAVLSHCAPVSIAPLYLTPARASRSRRRSMRGCGVSWICLT